MANYRYILGLFVVLALIIFAVGCASNSSPTAAPPQNPASAGPTAQAAKVKLSDTNYWTSAHLISGDTLDSSAKAAMSGFSMVKQVLADGTTQISLKSTNTEYTDQTYNLKQGEQLYFIETTMGDDPSNQEFNLGDDTAVIVDSDGYIVQK